MDTSWEPVRAAVLTRGSRDVDVHTARWEFTGDGPSPFGAVVCVHGLDGSHQDFRTVAPLLARHGTVWAPDLAGFGLTPPSGRSAALRDNRDLLAGFIDTVSRQAGVGPALVVGNSMGGLLSVLLAARFPELVGGLVLLSPSLPAPLGAHRLETEIVTDFLLFLVPVLGDRHLARRRRGPVEERVREAFERSGVDPASLPPGHLEDATALVAARRDLPWAERSYLAAARSIVRLLTVNRRRVLAAMDAVAAPTLLVHGDADQVVPVEAARTAAARLSHWRYREYAGVGHLPQLIDPVRVATDVGVWLTEQNSTYAPA